MAASTPAGRRLAAMQAAQATLDELNLDLRGSVDVFGAIDRLELDLAFMPLNNLLGALLPEGGVLLTTERPTAVQRYTAAHEIGHWVLDQEELALDGEVEIHGDSAVERERLAQLFASYFLMPPPLIRGTAARHGVRRGDEPTPAQVYVISRDVGASYEAVVRQLHNLEYYPWSHVRALLDVPVLRAKSDAAFGHRPVNGRADVWPLEHPSEGTELHVSVDDELVLALPENRTTGYRWLTASEDVARAARAASPPPPPFAPAPGAPDDGAAPASPAQGAPGERPAAAVRRSLRLLPPATEERPRPRRPDDDSPLPVVRDTYHASWAVLGSRTAATLRRALAGDQTAVARADMQALQRLVGGPPIGGTGTRVLSVRAMDEGAHTLRLVLAPPHDPTAEPVIELTITANVEAPPVVQHRRRVLDVDLDQRMPGDPPDDAVFSVSTAESR